MLATTVHYTFQLSNQVTRPEGNINGLVTVLGSGSAAIPFEIQK